MLYFLVKWRSTRGIILWSLALLVTLCFVTAIMREF